MAWRKGCWLTGFMLEHDYRFRQMERQWTSCTGAAESFFDEENKSIVKQGASFVEGQARLSSRRVVLSALVNLCMPSAIR